jgi:hypothetical protein
VSTALETTIADELLRLRRDVAGLQMALRAKDDALEAERRQRERLEKALRLVRVKSTGFALEMEQLGREV